MTSVVYTEYRHSFTLSQIGSGNTFDVSHSTDGDKYCGEVAPSPIVKTTEFVKVHFHSDHISALGRFRLHYKVGVIEGAGELEHTLTLLTLLTLNVFLLKRDNV